MTQDSERQVELESKIAFLERSCEELGEVILDQARSLEQLTLRLARLGARAAAAQEPGEDAESLADQRPPHY